MAVQRLSIVLVGAGVVAAKHKKAIDYLVKRHLAELSAVVDPNEQAAAALSLHTPVFASLSACLAEVKPDIVAITTPSGTHAELAELALTHGCHVLIEKPMTLSLKDADRLLQLAADAGKRIAVGHIFRYVPLADTLKSMVADGRFGRCLYGDVKVRWGHDQAYYDQAAWRGTYAADGGVLMNQSIHAIDLMQWLIGEKAVEAVAMAARQMHDMEGEDLALGIVRCTNNTYVQVEGTTNTDPARHEASFALFFEKGDLRVRLSAGQIEAEVNVQGRKPVSGKALLRQAVFAAVRREGIGIVRHMGNPHTFLYLDLVRAIANGGAVLADGQSGRDALATVLAIYRAAKERQVISVRSAVAFPLKDMVGVPALNPAGRQADDKQTETGL